MDDHAASYAKNMLSTTPDDKSDSAAEHNPEGKVVEVDELALESLKAKGPVLVDFYAPWCGQSVMSPVSGQGIPADESVARSCDRVSGSEIYL